MSMEEKVARLRPVPPTVEDRVRCLAGALQVTETQVAEAVPSQNYGEKARLRLKLDELLFDIGEYWKLKGVGQGG